MSNSFATPWTVHKGFPGDLGKHPPTSAGARRDRDFIPASRGAPGGEMATHSSVLACKIPWTKELGRLQSRYHYCSLANSCPTLLPHRGLQPTRLLCPRDFPGKNTGVVCPFLLQGIFSTQGLNPSQNLHCRQILYL